jgi:hypothetical protein
MSCVDRTKDAEPRRPEGLLGSASFALLPIIMHRLLAMLAAASRGDCFAIGADRADPFYKYLGKNQETLINTTKHVKI